MGSPTPPDDADLGRLAAAAGARALAEGERVVTVESCTGGYVAKLLTDVPGSSRWFDCGFVTYSNEAKQRDAGVAASTLEAHGAVSEAVVREMAAGALARTGAQRAIAISGVAGPEGGTSRNPVGSVWLALVARQADRTTVFAQHAQFAGDRDAIRRQAAALALEMLRGD